MIRAAKAALVKFASKVLDLDDTVKPEAHLRLYEDYLDRFSFDTDTTDVAKFLKELKRKHLVDEIVVATLNGSSIVSTNGNSVSQAVSGAALYNYVQSELPKSESVLIKSNGWQMLFKYQEKLYIVKASADLSQAELRALAREIDAFLSSSPLN